MNKITAFLCLLFIGFLPSISYADDALFTRLTFYGIRYEKQPIGQFGSKDSTIENNEVKP